jgi:hypothetical protein
MNKSKQAHASVSILYGPSAVLVEHRRRVHGRVNSHLGSHIMYSGLQRWSQTLGFVPPSCSQPSC